MERKLSTVTPKSHRKCSGARKTDRERGREKGIERKEGRKEEKESKKIFYKLQKQILTNTGRILKSHQSSLCFQALF